jgi:hypothetical protein
LRHFEVRNFGIDRICNRILMRIQASPSCTMKSVEVYDVSMAYCEFYPQFSSEEAHAFLRFGRFDSRALGPK